MTFFKANLRRILTSKIRLLIILVVPLLFIMTFATMEWDPPLQLAVIDQDQTAFTAELGDVLSGDFRLVTVSEDAIVEELIGGSMDYAVVIPSGFTEALIRGESPRLDGYAIAGTNQSVPIEAFINTYLDAAHGIAVAANFDEATFYRGMETFSAGNLLLEFDVNRDVNRAKSTMAMGFLVQFMLYMSVLTTATISEDRKNRTMYRIFSGPVTMVRYMTENLLSFIAVAFFQVIVIITVLNVSLNLYLGNSVWNMMLLFFFFAVVSIAFGLIITSYSKTPLQAYVTIFLVTTPLVMLGGSYWPRTFMPDILVQVGNFLPTSWVMSGVEKLLYGGSLGSITQELLVLTAFALVFFTVGILRRADVAK